MIKYIKFETDTYYSGKRMSTALPEKQRTWLEVRL